MVLVSLLYLNMDQAETVSYVGEQTVCCWMLVFGCWTFLGIVFFRTELMLNRWHAIALWAAILVGSAAADEWTRFRGPNGSGISHATTIPTTWGDDDYNWKIKLPGQGHSSPVIWGERLFVTSADLKQGKRFLLCINVDDGKTLWTREYPLMKFKKHKGNTYASTTPAVDEQHVYVLWQSRKSSSLVALGHDGEAKWKADLGPYKSGHGTGSSPIIHDGMVVVCNDHDADSFLVAFQANSGKVKWKVPRSGDRACYSTPCIFRRPGLPAEIIFTHSFRGITGVNAITGKTAWEIDVFGTHKQRAVGSPIIYKDLVIGSSGFTTAEKNVVAVRPTSRSDKREVKEVYRITQPAPHVPTPLVYAGRLYLWNDRGILTCVNADNGEAEWHGRVGGTYYGSPVCVNGYLYAVDADGNVAVVKTGDKLQKVAKVPLGETCRATPAVSGGRMYLRTVSHLFSLGK